MPGNSPATEQALVRMLPTIVVKVAITGVSAPLDLSAYTGRYLTLISDVNCHILGGVAGVVATTDALPLPRDQFTDFYIDGTFRTHVAVIKKAGEPDGILYVGITSDY